MEINSMSRMALERGQPALKIVDLKIQTGMLIQFVARWNFLIKVPRAHRCLGFRSSLKTPSTRDNEWHGPYLGLGVFFSVPHRSRPGFIFAHFLGSI